MARERDITRRTKFFTRKKIFNASGLCEKCQHHEHVLMVKVGCDAIIYTNTQLAMPAAFGRILNEGRFLHMWCLNEDDPPECLEQFREAGALR